jgi:predicted acetyltransferase
VHAETIERITPLLRIGETRVALVAPHVSFAAAFADMAREFEAHGERPFDRLAATLERDFAGYVALLERRLTFSSEAYNVVPTRTFWLLDEEERLLGVSSLRTTLTPFLENFIGHISISIRPSQRRRGLSKALYRLTLDVAREAGMERILAVTHPSNVASVRGIVSSGGRLDTRPVPLFCGEPVLRYWIVS